MSEIDFTYSRQVIMTNSFTSLSRIKCEALHTKVMSAEEAAALIPSGSTVGMSGFTGSWASSTGHRVIVASDF